MVIATIETTMKTRNLISLIGHFCPAKWGNARWNCQGQIKSNCFNLEANLFSATSIALPYFPSSDVCELVTTQVLVNEISLFCIFTVKLSKHSHQRTEEQIAIVTSTRIKGMFSSVCIQLPPATPKENPNKNPTPPQETEEHKRRTEVRRAGQRNEMTASSVTGVRRTAPVFLILKHFQEQRRKEFCGALHLHVQEAAGMAGSDHSQVCHFHQQFWPKVCNVVFSVINVVFECQEETLLTLFYPLDANKAWAICQYKEAELSILFIYFNKFLITNQEM